MRVFVPFYKDGAPGAAVLAAEGLLAAVLGVAGARALFPEHATLVSLFLAAISMDDTVERVLDANRRAIQEQGVSPRRANARLTGLLAALLFGMLLGFGIFAALLPLAEAQGLFSVQLGGAMAPFPALRFGAPGALLVHNLGVLLFFFAISLPYRHGGLLLAMAWNASAWGATVATLARRWAESGGPGLGEATLRVAAAVTPHLLLEGLAYAGAGLAGVFLSRGSARHAWGSPMLWSILESALSMLGIAAMLVGAGALWEGLVARSLVEVLAR